MMHGPINLKYRYIAITDIYLLQLFGVSVTQKHIFALYLPVMRAGVAQSV